MNRFNDELNDAANHQPVTFTGVDTVIRTAKHRSRRRAIATSVGTVGAVTAVTVIGVSQLSRPADPTEPVAAPPAATGDEYPPAVPASTTPIAPEPTISYEEMYAEELNIPGAVPATATSPMLTWRQVAAESPEALTLKLDPTQGYAIATSESSSSVLFEQTDDSWQQVATDVLPAQFQQIDVSDGKLYALGTAEGKRQAFVQYDPETAQLSEIDLPAEAIAHQSERVRSHVTMTSTPIDDGILIAIGHHGSQIRYELIEEMFGPTAHINRAEGGVWQLASNCDDVPPQATEPISTYAVETIPIEEVCDVRDVTAEELGLTEADVDALTSSQPSLLYKYTAEGFESVPLPADDIKDMALLGGALTVQTGDSDHSYAVASDGTLTEVFGDQPGAFARYPRVHDGRAVRAARSYLGLQTVGDPSSVVADVMPAVRDGVDEPFLDLYFADTVSDVSVGGGRFEYTPSDAPTEPVSVESSGFELRYTPDRGVQVIDVSTGKAPDFAYQLATESGNIELRRYVEQPVSATVVPVSGTSGTLAPEAMEDETELVAEFSVDASAIRPYSRRNEQVLVSTADGTSVAVERVSDLVNLGPGETVNYIDGIRASGDQVVVTVHVSDTDAEDNRRTVYLVGTPK